MTKDEINKYVKKWMKTYEPDTFIPNKHGQYIYRSENLLSGINLVCFFEELLEDYIESALANNVSTKQEQQCNIGAVRRSGIPIGAVRRSGIVKKMVCFFCGHYA